VKSEESIQLLNHSYMTNNFIRAMWYTWHNLV